MQELTVTKTRLFEGVWEGVITGAGDDRPDIKVTHLQEDIPGVELARKDGQADWVLRIPIPADRIADGVQTFLITDRATDTTLGSFSIVAGDELSYDIRAEVTLLREELDMLKRAFRRHCLETM